jgi:outer membrane protein OmpA-like peptidoglycan-associated protein
LKGGFIVNRKAVIMLGVILFLLLLILCILTHAGKIENRLTALSFESLKAAGLDGITVSFDGRTALLAGTVVSPDLIDQAKGIIGKINGVRSVRSTLTVTTPVEDVLEKKEIPDEKPAKVISDISSQLAGLTARFATNSSQPLNESSNALEQAIALLKEQVSSNIEIAGHADSRGTMKYNQRLSLRRANSVRNRLVKAGVDADRLIAKGYGETEPVAENSTPEGMAKNRRVEFRVIKEE